MAELPTGQISNHYELKDWNLFQVPEKEKANKWDGHTPQDVAKRMREFLTPKPKYPKTYEECLVMTSYDKEERILYLLEKFKQLLICRDAYWKLYGEEMGLGKPWKPDWNWRETKFCIGIIYDKIEKFPSGSTHYVLSFPTEEMRDAFYENFKDLIEQCKELL